MNIEIINAVKQIALYGRTIDSTEFFIPIYYLLEMTNPSKDHGRSAQEYIDEVSLNLLLKTHDLPDWAELKDYTIMDVIV